MKSVTDLDFDAQVIQNDKPVLVDFWAEWCAPCRMVGPVLEEISAEHGDRIDIVKLDVDENPKVREEYGIVAIPTMNVYRDGKVVKQIRGAQPKAALLRELAEFL